VETLEDQNDTIKELMSYPKCRSVKVINNPARLGSNHREINYINYNNSSSSSSSSSSSNDDDDDDDLNRTLRCED